MLNGEVSEMNIDWDYYKENPWMLPEEYKQEAINKKIELEKKINYLTLLMTPDIENQLIVFLIWIKKSY